MCDFNTLTPNCPCQNDGASVYQHGMLEAERFKWIQSERAGKDLGVSALHSWARLYWHRFVRERWLEHLEGRRYWIELDHDDFGLLQREFQDSPVIHEIIRILKEGGENLDVVIWSIHLSQSECDEVLEILEILDINSRRLEFLLDVRLSQAS
jgi:hypothetical protein